MRRSRRLQFGAAWLVALITAVSAAACITSDNAPPPTEYAPPAGTTPTPRGTLLATASLRTSTPTPRSDTPTPTGPTPTRSATPTNQPPLITWLIREHSGAGVVTVRIETNQPSTAIVRVVGKPGESTGVEPQASSGRSLAHLVSIPLPPDTFIQVEVKGDNGAIATGELEGGSVVVGNQYWGRGEAFPSVLFQGGYKGVVGWANLRESASPRRPASVQLFYRPTGCTTAQACRYTPGRVFRGDAVTIDGPAEMHQVSVTFDERNVDYLVLIEGEPLTQADGKVLYRFFQMEVKGSDVKP